MCLLLLGKELPLLPPCGMGRVVLSLGQLGPCLSRGTEETASCLHVLSYASSTAHKMLPLQLLPGNSPSWSQHDCMACRQPLQHMILSVLPKQVRTTGQFLCTSRPRGKLLHETNKKLFEALWFPQMVLCIPPV